ncbi:MAG: hypothetical protein LBD37_09655 [Treponema sp.]|jgi:diaminopimelate epimerase|nr:hypothetical protein [Treponema sp.]
MAYPGTYDLVLADPANNITLLVLNPVAPADRAGLARRLLQDPALGAEQVGFAVPPRLAAAEVYGRLEMMGGEFCGNAARSFGLYAAARAGIPGARRVFIECSGADHPVPIRVDTGASWAEAEMPNPLAQDALRFAGRALPVWVFPGITHVIAAGLIPSRETFFAIKALLEQAAGPPEALGILFLDILERAMIPCVYVYKTGTLVFESSCGSGSTALALHKTRDLADGEAAHRIRQPGGVIDVRVVKRAGAVESAAAGGPVRLRALVWTDPDPPSPGG